MMKLKKIVYALMLSLIFPVFADASIVVEVDNLDPNAGTFGLFTSTATPAGQTNSFTYVGTSDFDMGGVADTLSFTLTRTTYAAGTITGSDVAVGTVNNGGNTSNWYSNFADAETLQVQISNIVYTSGEANGATAVFGGFQEIGRTNISGNTGDIDFLVHTGPVGSTPFTSMNTGIDLTSVGTSNTVFITAADTAANNIRLRDLDLHICIEPVPEPSSLMLLGLAVSGLTFRRNRRV